MSFQWQKTQRSGKWEEYLIFEAEASLAVVVLAWAEVTVASTLVGGGERWINAEAPICLSFGRRTLGGWSNSFLNIASHHEANSSIAEGAILNFSK